ncbi:MAG: hypothetical protein ACC662_07850, partial [Planctomycetota bacterium]
GVVDAVVDRAAAMSWVPVPLPRRVLVLDDDGIDGRGRILREVGEGAGARVDVLDLARGDRLPEDARAVGPLTVVVLASVRAAKPGAGLSPAGRRAVEALIAGAGLPGAVSPSFVCCGARGIPGGVHLPGSGPALERALAARLFAPAGGESPGPDSPGRGAAPPHA